MYYKHSKIIQRSRQDIWDRFDLLVMYNTHLMYPLMMFQMPSGSDLHSSQPLLQVEF